MRFMEMVKSYGTKMPGRWVVEKDMRRKVKGNSSLQRILKMSRFVHDLRKKKGNRIFEHPVNHVTLKESQYFRRKHAWLIF